MDSATIYEINHSIQKIVSSIRQKIEQNTSMPRIIFMGSTGSGKSSLISCLTSNNTVISLGAGNKAVLVGPGISSGVQSGTREPSIIIDSKSNLIYIDTPGFDDTNGISQEIINSFVIDSLFTFPFHKDIKYKILLVISASEFDSHRAKSISNSFDRITKMFPNNNNLIEKTLGLVITKGENGIDGENYIEMLEDNAQSNLKLWIDIYKSRPEDIFVFPMASKSKVGEKYEFDDHQRLCHFLCRNQIINPFHIVVLSDSVTLYIRNCRNNISQKIQENVNNIFDIIRSNCNKIKSTLELEKWNEWINKISMFRSNVENLESFFVKYIPNSDQYIKYLTNLKEYESMMAFYDDKILFNDIYEPVLRQKISSSAFDAMIEINELIKRQIIEEEYERQTRMQEKMREQQEEKAEEYRRIEKELINDINKLKLKQEIQKKLLEELIIQSKRELELQNRMHQSQRCDSSGSFCIIS